MIRITRVSTPPTKPTLVYDGDCGFCRIWIQRWRQITQDHVVYERFQDSAVRGRFSEIALSEFQASVQLIETDGSIYGGARAALGALSKNPRWLWLLNTYDRWPHFAAASENSYRFVATHRRWFSRLTRIAWGDTVEKPTQHLVRSLFLKALAVIYIFAFASLGTQIIGLAGKQGIMPAEQLMAGIKQHVAANGIGLDRYRLLPTLCWFDASDQCLRFQCVTGVLLAVCVLFGIAPGNCLFLLWLLYLSLASVSGVFLGFQWDALLLETGFLAVFLAPVRLWPSHGAIQHDVAPSQLVLWLSRLLLFKLMFQSGCVKLLSGDPTWHNLTALAVHYETQPLPTWIGWYAHQLPIWFQKLSCLIIFGIELILPFLFFAPRRLRFFAAGATALLQIAILLSGNYTFFNWLTLALCIPLLDDLLLANFLPMKWRQRRMSSGKTRPPSSLTPATRSRWRRVATLLLAAVCVPIALLQLLAMFRVQSPLLAPITAMHHWVAPLRSVNTYGLFAVMTTSRSEIILEGSDDGVKWLAYEFKYKPGEPTRRPGFVAPHQPRLDWQMWFAALGTAQQNPWFGNLVIRLLEGSPEVVALLERNPFPAKPPRYIRAVEYDYRLTGFAERRASGVWWRREKRGLYLPVVSLQREKN